MKRFVIALLAFIACLIGIFAALFAIVAFGVAQEQGKDNYRFFFGGTAITCFVISWLLLKISRQNKDY